MEVQSESYKQKSLPRKSFLSTDATVRQQIIRQCQDYYLFKLVLEIPYSSKFELTFIHHLLTSLNQSLFFEANVVLIQQQLKSPKNQLNLNPSAQYCLVAYTWNYHYRDLQDKKRQQVQMKESCLQLHNILLTIKKRYALQNKWTYWDKMLNQVLKSRFDRINNQKKDNYTASPYSMISQ